MDPAEMWQFLTLVITRLHALVDVELNKITAQLGVIMATETEILADLAAVKINLTETKDDLKEVMDLNTQQLANIAVLDAAVAALTAQIGAGPQLDAIAAAVLDIKDTSRQIADVVPEAPAAVEPPPQP